MPRGRFLANAILVSTSLSYLPSVAFMLSRYLHVPVVLSIHYDAIVNIFLLTMAFVFFTCISILNFLHLSCNMSNILSDFFLSLLVMNTASSAYLKLLTFIHCIFPYVSFVVRIRFLFIVFFYFYKVC